MNFLTELFLNLFSHNYSTRVDLRIEGNVIEVLDYSRKSFDPFTAVSNGNGNGIVVYQMFLEKYKDWISPLYEPGYPNAIKLEFDPKILDYRPVNPCDIEVGQVHLLSPRDLNKYEFDPNCPEIVLDISRSLSCLSFIVRNLFEYLVGNTLDSQMVVLKCIMKTCNGIM